MVSQSPWPEEPLCRCHRVRVESLQCTQNIILLTHNLFKHFFSLSLSPSFCLSNLNDFFRFSSFLLLEMWINMKNDISLMLSVGRWNTHLEERNTVRKARKKIRRKTRKLALMAYEANTKRDEKVQEKYEKRRKAVYFQTNEFVPCDDDDDGASAEDYFLHNAWCCCIHFFRLSFVPRRGQNQYR